MFCFQSRYYELISVSHRNTLESSNAPDICIHGSPRAGDSGGTAGLKCGDLTLTSHGNAGDVQGSYSPIPSAYGEPGLLAWILPRT